MTDLVGPELLALHQKHLGSCTYAFYFNVSVPGPYRLTVTVLRSNYSALDEVCRQIHTRTHTHTHTCGAYVCSDIYRLMVTVPHISVDGYGVEIELLGA